MHWGKEGKTVRFSSATVALKAFGRAASLAGGYEPLALLGVIQQPIVTTEKALLAIQEAQAVADRRWRNEVEARGWTPEPAKIQIQADLPCGGFVARYGSGRTEVVVEISTMKATVTVAPSKRFARLCGEEIPISEMATSLAARYAAVVVTAYESGEWV